MSDVPSLCMSLILVRITSSTPLVFPGYNEAVVTKRLPYLIKFG